ncbi:MAG TPA: TIGR04255 family protein [Chthoniobacteraceae bacterium]|jgi:uncharacterized protein (TIGR04255 family)|nr:TIGR04255 family protein [Chthoniobacteraceae bacterium]
MSETRFQLAVCPIIEAVIDVRCDMPPGFDLAASEERAHTAFGDSYKSVQRHFVRTHRFEVNDLEATSAEEGLEGLQFLQEDGRQLVQVRTQGFSFNRLAPYTSLDDYLPEFERTWKLFVNLTTPALIREVRLRYINRLLLPIVDDQVEFNAYLRISPRLPDEERLAFLTFFNQYTAVEVESGYEVNSVMTLQASESNRLPLILDIEVVAKGSNEPNDWEWIRVRVDELRSLKNRVFKNTLTDKCLNLYSRSES